jgi:hypothetical protein
MHEKLEVQQAASGAGGTAGDGWVKVYKVA